MNTSRVAAGALALALAACGSSAGGGGRRTDDGGTGGGGPVDGTTEPVPVELSFVSFSVATQVWAPGFNSYPSFPTFELLLEEDAGGCPAQASGYLGAPPHVFRAFLGAPAVGDCPDGPVGQPGCRSLVDFVPGYGRGIASFSVPAAASSVRIDRFDGGILAGELRASFYVNPETPSPWGPSDPSVRECLSTTGAMRRCVPATPDDDCCNEGKPLEEVVIPFEATLCPRVGGCEDERHCAALEAAATCPVPAVDCETACAGFVDSCPNCLGGCEGEDWCEEMMADQCAWFAEPCPAACAAGANQPLASVGLACLSAATCDDWLSCLSTCGGTR